MKKWNVGDRVPLSIAGIVTAVSSDGSRISVDWPEPLLGSTVHVAEGPAVHAAKAALPAAPRDATERDEAMRVLAAAARACVSETDNRMQRRLWVPLCKAVNAAEAALAHPPAVKAAPSETVEMARAEERERCAKVCEAYGREGDRNAREHAADTADELAARIRALSAPPSAAPANWNETAWNALENTRLLAMRLRKTDPENAAHFLRFCASAGVEGSVLRAAPPSAAPSERDGVTAVLRDVWLDGHFNGANRTAVAELGARLAPFADALSRRDAPSEDVRAWGERVAREAFLLGNARGFARSDAPLSAGDIHEIVGPPPSPAQPSDEVLTKVAEAVRVAAWEAAGTYECTEDHDASGDVCPVKAMRAAVSSIDIAAIVAKARAGGAT